MNYNYIYEGEIISAYPNKSSKRQSLLYTCRVVMSNGDDILVSGVEQSTIFGGIDDYLQFKNRTSSDTGGSIKLTTQDNANARIGDRVLITFLGGNVFRPVIIGYLQHPNQSYELDGSDISVTPQLIFQYLGLRVEVDEDGQMTLTRKGAPKIIYTGTDSAAGILGAAASLLGGIPQISTNPAVIPPAETEVTVLEILKEGTFRVRDEEGQFVEINRSNKQIIIGNDGFTSTDPIGGPPLFFENSENIVLDKGEKSVTLYARDLYELNVQKDKTENIGGDSDSKIIGAVSMDIGDSYDEKIASDSSSAIGGDRDVKIAGDHKEDIAGDLTYTIGGDSKATILGDKKDSTIGKWSVLAVGDVEITGSLGSKLKLANGMVGLGGPAAELLDLIDQQLDAMINNASAFVYTAVGPGTLSPVVLASLVQIKVLLNLIKGGI